MTKDLFDKSLIVALVLTAGALLLLLATAGGSGSAVGGGSLDRTLEREMAYQARTGLLQKLYGPVTELRRQGNSPAALLKLDELERSYPGEAHGHILKGQLLLEMGALPEAAASYARGVRLNGDYVDDKSPLQQRMEIGRLVEQGLSTVGARAQRQPDNPGLATALKELHYLQSRLAGGCE